MKLKNLSAYYLGGTQLIVLPSYLTDLIKCSIFLKVLRYTYND